MRVAHVTRGRVNCESANGVERMIYQTASMCASRGLEMSVLSITPKEPLPIPGVKVQCVPPERGRVVPQALLKSVRDGRYDVLHLHSLFSPVNTQVSRVCNRASVPFVVTPHGVLSRASLRVGLAKKVTYLEFFDRSLLAAAGAVQALSEVERTDILRWQPRGRVELVPNGASVLDGRINRQEVDDAFPETVGVEYLLYVGRLDLRRKGLDLMLSAMALTHRQRPNLKLVVAGPVSDDLSALKRYAAQLGLDESIIWLDAVWGRKKDGLVQNARAFVQTSPAEGMALGLLEALGAGVPLVVTEGADPEGLASAAGGWRTAHEAAAVSRAMLESVELDETRRKEIVASGQDLILRYYSWDRSVDGLLELYAALNAHSERGIA